MMSDTSLLLMSLRCRSTLRDRTIWVMTMVAGAEAEDSAEEVDATTIRTEEMADSVEVAKVVAVVVDKAVKMMATVEDLDPTLWAAEADSREITCLETMVVLQPMVVIKALLEMVETAGEDAEEVETVVAMVLMAVLLAAMKKPNRMVDTQAGMEIEDVKLRPETMITQSILVAKDVAITTITRVVIGDADLPETEMAAMEMVALPEIAHQEVMEVAEEAEVAIAMVATTVEWAVPLVAVHLETTVHLWEETNSEYLTSETL